MSSIHSSPSNTFQTELIPNLKKSNKYPDLPLEEMFIVTNYVNENLFRRCKVIDNEKSGEEAINLLKRSFNVQEEEFAIKFTDVSTCIKATISAKRSYLNRLLLNQLRSK
jgi:hypothetical protein